MSNFIAIVAFEGRILIDRSYCLNESETQRFLKERIEESSPLKLRNISTTVVERIGNNALYEVDAILQGTVTGNKPLAKDDIKNMVQNLTQRVGFDTDNISVRSVEKTSEEDSEGETEEPEISDQFVQEHFRTSPRLNINEVEALKTGDKIQIQRAGFYEEAEVISVDPLDNTVEVRTQHAYTTEWIPAVRVRELVKQ